MFSKTSELQQISEETNIIAWTCSPKNDNRNLKQKGTWRELSIAILKTVGWDHWVE